MKEKGEKGRKGEERWMELKSVKKVKKMDGFTQNLDEWVDCNISRGLIIKIEKQSYVESFSKSPVRIFILIILILSVD